MLRNMNNLNLLSTYCKVVELGSFSKAAIFLQQPKSRVSRAISRLEDSLNTHLIKRTTRQFSLTESGVRLFERIQPLIRELENELARIESSARSDEISGTLTISAPEDFGQFILGDMIKAFRIIHPNLGIKVHLTNEFLDFAKHNIDLAIRFVRLTDSPLVQAKFGEVKMILVASTKYLQKFGTPKKVEDLAEHKLIFFLTNNGTITLGAIKAPLPNSISCNSFPMLFNMVKSDQGIGLVPDFLCKEELKGGEVQRVLVSHEPSATSFHIVYPQSKALPKRVREFIDFAKIYMKSTASH